MKYSLCCSGIGIFCWNCSCEIDVFYITGKLKPLDLGYRKQNSISYCKISWKCKSILVKRCFGNFSIRIP